MATPSSSSVPVQEIQPQADPLPTKRGEIGFRESLHGAPPEDTTGTDITESLPPRHPADTDPAHSPAARGVPTSTPPHAHQSLLCALFKPSKYHKSGIHPSTIILLATQFTFLFITIASWVLLIKLVLQTSIVAMLVHIVFALSCIFQCLLLERTTFRLRAERYAVLHPGEVIPPTLLHPYRLQGRLALAPWNRPPLPTYAAVLTDSGFGTGDVEDNRIAIPPPPAYGFTRGSTLISAGIINEDMRNEGRRVQAERGERLSVISQETASRPMSYVSRYSEWEARCDMTRARILEENLCRLQSEADSSART